MYPSNSMVQNRLGSYAFQNRWIWKHFPAIRHLSIGRKYASCLHEFVLEHSDRSQNHSTFFLRNRAELELMRRLIDQKDGGAKLDLTVLACSKGAEVYSILWTLRTARPDLKITTRAIDISQDIVDYAKRAAYPRNAEVIHTTNGDVTINIFERLSPREMDSMFDVNGGEATVKPWLREGIQWMSGDANDPQLAEATGKQDIVVANRFLCHMKPPAAERCLRNIARFVKPGGYLFVSGVDVEVRTRVAKDLGWKPVMEMIREVHEGDDSLRNGWPLEYYGLEPFCEEKPDWKIRYASVFQIA